MESRYHEERDGKREYKSRSYSDRDSYTYREKYRDDRRPYRERSKERHRTEYNSRRRSRSRDRDSKYKDKKYLKTNRDGRGYDDRDSHYLDERDSRQYNNRDSRYSDNSNRSYYREDNRSQGFLSRFDDKEDSFGRKENIYNRDEYASSKRAKREDEDIPVSVNEEESMSTEDDDDLELMKKMGLPTTFNTTKGKKVEGNDVYVVNKQKKRKYRQYMNRKGMIVVL